MSPATDSRLLRIVLRVFGLVFLFGVYPLTVLWPSGWAWTPAQPAYLQMIVGIYATLGVFLLRAARAPERHQSLLWFTVWSSVVHAGIMAVHAVTDPGEIGHLWGDVAALLLVAGVLGVLLRRQRAAPSAIDEPTRLEDRLRAAFEGPAWHGPAVLEALAGVGAAEAATRPVAGAHTIWELVRHLGGAYDLVLRRTRGDGRQLAPEEDWPAVPAPTEANWRSDVAELHARNRAARAALQKLDPARLAAPLVAEAPYSAYEQFLGLTQHDLYHAGQIMLLRRALLAGPTAPAV